VLLAFAPAAQAGEKEPPITGEGPRAVYLRAMHATVHPHWAETFVRNAASRLPANHPVNDPKRSAVVAVTLISDGTLFGLQLEKSSGSPEFDAAVLASFPDTSFPLAPDESTSDDGRAHLRWVFTRDHRQCSGISVVLKEAPLDEALPRLLARGRDREVIRRVRAVGPAGFEVALTALARAWLERSFEQTARALPAAIGLAALGDERGVDLLREASRGDRVAAVTAALRHLKIDVPAVPPPPAPPAARLPSETLIKALRGADAAARLEAAAVLSTRGDGAARQALAGLARGPDRRLRLFGAGSLGPKERAELFAAVGSEGKAAYHVLVYGPARPVAVQWLVSEFDKLLAAAQAEALSDWLWASREGSSLTLSAR
jgi:hypothetical protein